MFGRRSRRAIDPQRLEPLVGAHVAPPSPSPVLPRDELVDVVHRLVDECFGEHGDWTLTRRTPSDIDTFFHTVAANDLTRRIVDAIGAGTDVPDDAESTSPPDSDRSDDRWAPLIRSAGIRSTPQLGRYDPAAGHPSGPSLPAGYSSSGTSS